MLPWRGGSCSTSCAPRTRTSSSRVRPLSSSGGYGPRASDLITAEEKLSWSRTIDTTLTCRVTIQSSCRAFQCTGSISRKRPKNEYGSLIASSANRWSRSRCAAVAVIDLSCIGAVRVPLPRIPRHHPETTACHSDSPNWTLRASSATRKCGSQTDPDVSYRAFLAIDNTRCGPALGGTRLMPYADDDAALTECASSRARHDVPKCAGRETFHSAAERV